ncbi:hypothetical protein [Limisalsivibrio acetivorans]|uniref:hypothetical protein n=1 Tax=Limisalsivibrio acetivorans TaxID=1304888 RepID=UPI0003B37811|nr:hypothetical protein [Limisalsivibrio acetivorans]
MKRITISVLMLLSLFIWACGGANSFESFADDDSGEARDYEIQQALDDGDYDKVIDMLEDETDLSDQEQIYLASAYLGQVGIDFINILDVVDSDNINTFNVMASMFGYDNVTAGVNRVGEKTVEQYYDALTKSLTALEEANEDADVKTLRGIAGAMDLIMIVAEAAIDITGVNVLPLTAEGVENALDNAGVEDVSAQQIIDSVENADVRIDRDMKAVAGTIEVFLDLNNDVQGASDLQEKFEDFMDELDYDGDDVYDADDIAHYINNEVY